MKKSVLAGVLAAVMLLSGCSGVSQDEYNSLLEENSKLKENSSSSPIDSDTTLTNSDTTSNIKSKNKIANTANDLLESGGEPTKRFSEKDEELSCQTDWYIYDKGNSIYMNQFNNISDKEIANSIYILSNWHKLGVNGYEAKKIEWEADYLVFKRNDGTVIAGEKFVNKKDGNYSHEIEWSDECVKAEYEKGLSDKSFENSFNEYLKKYPRDDIESETNSTTSDNTSIDVNEMIENGEAVVSPLTGVIWLFSKEDSAYITNVGFDPFVNRSDEDKIGLCYLDALYFASDEQFADDYFLFLVWGEPNSNNVVARCTITHFLGETSISDNSIVWENEWKEFNNSDINKKYIELIKNYDFSKITDNFELDGYKVNFTGKYDFVILDNQFSSYNGQTLLTVNVDIENLSNDFDSRGYSYCTLYCQASAPDGSGLSTLDAYLGDNGILGSKIYVGQTFNGNIAVPYVGDGEYRFEFKDIGDNRKYVYKIDVTKS